MRGRLVLAIVAVVVIALLVFFFAVKPKRDELAEVRAQIEAEEARTVQLRTELARLQAIQASAAARSLKALAIRSIALQLPSSFRPCSDSCVKRSQSL